MEKTKTKTYQNIMELLVIQEVERQLDKLPPALARYIDPIEVTTYALNRLPPLYASSEKGKEKQYQRAKKENKQEITTAVRQAIAAVERDPLRVSTPLTPELEPEYRSALASLQDIQILLTKNKLIPPQTELNWENLVKAIKYALQQAAKRQKTQEPLSPFSSEPMATEDWNDQRYHR
jgi:hypothetical protein